MPRVPLALLLLVVMVAQGASAAVLRDGSGAPARAAGDDDGSVTGRKKPSKAPPPSTGSKSGGAPKPAPGASSAPKPPPAAPLPPPAPAEAAPAADGLSSEWTPFAAIGAFMRLPVGATVTRLAGEEFPAWQVEGGPQGPPWRLRVEQAWAADPAADCAEQARNALKGLGSGGTQVKVLVERAGTVSGCETRTVWASATRGDVTTIAGWLLARTGDGIFVSMAAAASPKDFAEIEGVLDRSFATLKLVDPRLVQAERDAAIGRGQAFLKSLDAGRVQALADGTSQVRRLWRLAADGTEEELGWVETRITRAPRSRAGRGGPSVLNRAGEQEEGLLITIIARTMASDGTDRVETRANYWVSWDLTSEAWTSRSDQKGSGPKRHLEQIGLMPRVDGASGAATLMVATDVGAGMGEPATWSRPPTAYLPQAIALVLGRLLPRDGSAPGDLVFYALDPASGRLCQRLVRWAKDASMGDRWCLSVQNTPDTPPTQEWYDERGQFARRREADGSCMDPSTPADIERRWRRLGLEP